MKAVRCRLLLSGVLIWLGSRLPPATSASIGVNRRALVSLTRVMATDGSPWNSSSRHAAVRMPANPPPRMRMFCTGSGSGGAGRASGPNAAAAR